MNLYIKLNCFKKNTIRFKHICRLCTQYAYNYVKQTNHLSQNRTYYIPILLLQQRFFSPFSRKTTTHLINYKKNYTNSNKSKNPYLERKQQLLATNQTHTEGLQTSRWHEFSANKNHSWDLLS